MLSSQNDTQKTCSGEKLDNGSGKKGTLAIFEHEFLTYSLVAFFQGDTSPFLLRYIIFWGLAIIFWYFSKTIGLSF
jgi:hypothetical protein